MDEAEAQQKARAFISRLDISNIKNDLSVYAKAINAKIVFEELDDGESGYTITKPNGKHVITINSRDPVERQRFTICHEIAHIVLGLPSSHSEIPSWAYVKRDLNEVLCDTFSAELLMPYAEWRRKTPKTEPSVQVIEHMAKEFQTSFPAAASRYATLADRPCAFVTMDLGIVRYAARSMSLRKSGAWIPPKSPIPPGSVAHRLQKAKANRTEVAEIAQDVWFQDWEKGLDLWELARHFVKRDSTIALLWFDEEDLQDIEVDRFSKRVVADEDLPELTGELPWPGKNKRR